MLNFGSKSENETFLITRICEFTETWVVTQRDIKGHIKSTEQYDCKLFFRLVLLLYLPTQIHFLIGGERVTCHWSKLNDALGRTKRETTTWTLDSHVITLCTLKPREICVPVGPM